MKTNSTFRVLACLSLLIVIVCAGQAVLSERTTAVANRTNECENWALPVKNGKIINKFDKPEKRWLAGHRGIDIKIKQDKILYAPEDGIISYSSTVAGKPVVSLSHGNLRSTFEPAETDKPVGYKIKKGEPLGTIAPEDDSSNSHCSINGCVHWGLKTNDKDYINPEYKINCCPIVLLE